MKPFKPWTQTWQWHGHNFYLLNNKKAGFKIRIPSKHLNQFLASSIVQIVQNPIPIIFCCKIPGRGVSTKICWFQYQKICEKFLIPASSKNHHHTTGMHPAGWWFSSRRHVCPTHESSFDFLFFYWKFVSHRINVWSVNLTTWFVWWIRR